MTEQELLKIKSDIDKSKSTVSELKGQETALLAQLKEWKCTTVEQAEKKLKEMKSEISVYDEKFEKGTEELKTKYNV